MVLVRISIFRPASFVSVHVQLMERESIAKVIPDPEKVCEFVVMMRKMHGLK